MADKTPPESAWDAPRGQSLADVAPQLPVIKKEDVNGPFLIRAVDTFSGRYGESWRAECINKDGELFLVLLQGNEVRDTLMRRIDAAIRTNGKPVGPVHFVMRKLESGRQTWELEDA